MKRRRLLKHLSANGCQLRRHGRKHDIFLNPEAPIPRHQEVKGSLVRLIRRQLDIPRP